MAQQEDRVRIRVKRQDGPEARPYWQEFAVPRRPGMNVIACLMAIRENPVTARGEPTTPVAWESSCLEEVCGSCAMIINGRARMACTALVDRLRQPVVLEPLTAFPVVRDLIVDRSAIFETLKRVKAWLPLDGTHPLGPGPRYSESERQLRYALSKCFTCGICLDVCPNYHRDGRFIGPQPLGQVLYHLLHPTGQLDREERLEAIMGDDGITNCGHAQNCGRMCPKAVPLLHAIARLQGETTRHALRRWLWR